MKKKEIEKICLAFESQLQSFGIPFKKITPLELSKLQQKWREIFSANVKKQTGEWVHHDYDWHAFSYGFFPHLLGVKAIQEYQSLTTKKISIVFASKAASVDDVFGYILEPSQKPPYDFLRNFLYQWPRLTDMYISHENFSWTFVLTHEDFEKDAMFGPYFARSKDMITE